MRRRAAWIAAGALVLAGCGERARLSDAATHGPDPTLPKPHPTLVPTTAVATARGWPADVAPRPAAGLRVQRFAGDLDHPRWLHVLPNGDVLVAETNRPPRSDDDAGLRGWVGKRLMKKAGAGVRSADRITLLRDADGDGVAEFRSILLEGLSSPFGMALAGGQLYVANCDALVRFPYADGDTRIAAPAETVVVLPGGPRNHHWTKNVVANPEGDRLYVTVGSNSNVAEYGLEIEEGRAAIWVVDPTSGEHRIYASGLRNPNGLDFEPVTGALWTAVNERDEIGSDLVPDYITSVRDGGFYGWPWSYFGQHVDERVQPPRPDLVATAIRPDYAVGNHTGSLGLAFARGGDWPAEFQSGVFVGQHGSWNRRPRSGYKVIFVPFREGRPDGQPRDVLTGFLDDDGNAYGRPVGVVTDRTNALLVADDVGNAVWRVTRE